MTDEALIRIATDLAGEFRLGRTCVAGDVAAGDPHTVWNDLHRDLHRRIMQHRLLRRTCRMTPQTTAANRTTTQI
jgi:hypothetical protein